jgi:hypothetical protein
MSIYVVKKTFLVEVVKMAPAASKELAEHSVSKRFKDLITECLCKDNFIVTEPEVADCEVVDLDVEVFGLDVVDERNPKQV